MPDEFKARPIYLLPEALALLAAGLLTYLIVLSKVELQAITFFPETPSGATLNTLTFVIIMGCTASFTYLLVKYRLMKLVTYMIKVAFIFVVFLLINWYGGVSLKALKVSEEAFGLHIAAISVAITGVLAFATNRKRGVWPVLGVVSVGALIGTFLGASIPLLTAVVLLAGLGIYDVIAVYKGPIGKIAKKAELEDFVGAVFTFKDLTTGLGDIVFYTMLASAAMLNFGYLPFIGASTGVLLGTYAVFKLLETREMFPGLPFSLGFGLIMMLATAHAQNLIFKT